jgi:hypothetical protein
MDKGGSSENDAPSSKKKKGPRRSKKGNLIIDETHIIQPDEIPKGSRFKGYQERVIQDITFQTHNVCYRLAEYTTPEGLTIVGQLLISGSFGLGEFIEYIVKQFFNICLWIMRSYVNHA